MFHEYFGRSYGHSDFVLMSVNSQIDYYKQSFLVIDTIKMHNCYFNSNVCLGPVFNEASDKFYDKP